MPQCWLMLWGQVGNDPNDIRNIAIGQSPSSPTPAQSNPPPMMTPLPPPPQKLHVNEPSDSALEASREHAPQHQPPTTRSLSCTAAATPATPFRTAVEEK